MSNSNSSLHIILQFWKYCNTRFFHQVSATFIMPHYISTVHVLLDEQWSITLLLCWKKFAHEKVFEVIVDSDCIWSWSYKVSSSSWKECGKGTRDVILCIGLVDWCPTAWVWLMRSSFINRLLDGLPFCQFLQGGHHKGIHPVEVTILGHHQMTPVSWSIGQSSPW